MRATHDYLVRSATPADLPFIRDTVERLHLDSEDLRAEQFIVVEDRRGRGIGEMVVRELIRRFPQGRVYVTTDIPEYFRRLGFAATTSLPRELSENIRRVDGRLRSGVVGMVCRRRAVRRKGGAHDG